MALLTILRSRLSTRFPLPKNFCPRIGADFKCMGTLINVPSMGDSISEGTIVDVLKAPGDSVQVDEVVVVLETDKVILRVPKEILLSNT